jgi:hypothetical protein
VGSRHIRIGSRSKHTVFLRAVGLYCQGVTDDAELKRMLKKIENAAIKAIAATNKRKRGISFGRAA